MRAFDEQCQHSARLAAGREADRFRRGDLGVALADDLGPAADDGALDETEALERLPADVTDQVTRGARTAAALGIFWLSLRHALPAWHSKMVTANTAALLLQHYVDNFRRLPWRSAPGEKPPEPYRVWLSEIMLQQTTVAAVRPRFERFVTRWCTVEALAAAPDEDVLSEWAGLGYYARARNLIACAREVVTRGAFPTTAAELRDLPGIGPYTGASIAAIAFGERAAAVDTNVRRVTARLNGIEEPTAEQIESLVLGMIPTERAGDFTQAIMDLGATICRPKSPLCEACPLREHCLAFASGNPEVFPAAKQRRERPHRYGVAYWTERNGEVWLTRRPAKGMLGGMAALPGGDWADAPLHGANPIGTVRHVFTHFSLDLHVVLRSDPIGEGWWHPIDRLDEAGLPTLYRKAADIVLAEERRRAA
jgi:A/G-specific adenine glycosylase